MSTETFTELLRHPRDVAAQTENGAVRITRRGADDLILVRAGDLERHEEGIALASRLMRATVKCGGDITAALGELNAWVALLSKAEQHQCAEEIESLLWSAAELGEYRRLLGSFHSWQATAQAYAAGTPRDDDDLTWLSDLPAVARP